MLALLGGAGGAERLYNGATAELDGPFQRRFSVKAAAVGVRARVEERSHHPEISEHACQHQCRLAAAILVVVDVGACGEQRSHNGEGAIGAGVGVVGRSDRDVQRRVNAEKTAS